MNKKTVCFFLMLFLLVLSALPTYAATPIKLFVNNRQITPDVPPIIVKGRVLVPARAILEPLGAQFSWDSKARTVTINKGGKTVFLTIGRKNAVVNGIKYPLETAAAIVKGRTFIPLRFVAEAFSAYVQWQSTQKTVIVVQNGSTVKRDMAVTGYYFDSRSLADLENNVDTITDSINFSYHLNSQGRVQEDNYFDQGYQFAKQHGMSVEMLVFANDRAQLKTFLADTGAQKVVIEDIYRFLQSRDFDGVDMDFEFIDSTQGTQYVSFIKALKEKIGPRYTLSISIPARSSASNWWYDGYDYAALAKIADRILVMTYDQHYAGGTPGPVGGNDWVEQVINYLLPLIPKEKFQLGLGIYGYDWPAKGQGKAIYVQAARDLATAKGAEILKDEASGASYFWYTDDSGMSHQVWFEDRDSIQAKLELVEKYDLSGIALWCLGIIPPDIWAIINNEAGN